MSGFEIILTTALCLSCANNGSVPLPPGLITLDANGDPITVVHAPQNTMDTTAEETYTSDEFIEFESQRLKRAQQKYLREWLNGRHLRIVTLEDYPLSFTEVTETGTRIGRGVSFEIIDFLQEKYNFTYEVMVPQSNIIGSTDDFADSLIQVLNNSDADLAAAFLPLLTDSRGYIAYSTTTLDEGEWIMVMQRPSESASGSGLLAPFEFWVWILIMVSLLAVGPIIYLLIILRNKLTGDTDQKPYSIGHCAWFVYGALMKQGSILSPVADSTRLLFATWWIFITILTSFYTANLTAFLTLSKFTLPFNTVNDILNKNKHFVSSRGGGIEYSIRNTNESLSMLYKMILNNRALFSDVVNDSYNLENYVERNGYVFVRDRPAINHVLYRDYRYRKTINMENEKIHCPFAMAKQPFLKKKRSFAYPIGSNLSLIFDPELLNLVESGIVKHLSMNNLPNAEICPQDLGGTERQLRNGDLMMTYYIMFAGFATSVAVFSSEIIFRCINGRRETGKWSTHGVGRTCNNTSTDVLIGPWAFNGKSHNRFSSNINANQAKHHGDGKRRLGASNLNITPPPPYQSIFGAHKRANNGVGGGGGGGGAGFMRRNVDQSDEQLEQQFGGVRRVINGRDYLVVRTPNGQQQLVPMRAPSAALFQYTYTE